MNAISRRWIAAGLSGACLAATVGCYPAYPPSDGYSAYNGDAKGGDVGPAGGAYADSPEGGYADSPVAPPQQYPRYAGVDPGLAIAGVATAGVLGYALGHNHGYYHPHYYGPRFYRPAYYGRAYYGRAYYGRAYYGPRYHRR